MMCSVIGHPLLRLLLHEDKAIAIKLTITIATNNFFIEKRFNVFYFCKVKTYNFSLLMKNGLYFNLLLKITVNFNLKCTFILFLLAEA
jgi:hypothetical protein